MALPSHAQGQSACAPRPGSRGVTGPKGGSPITMRRLLRSSRGRQYHHHATAAAAATTSTAATGVRVAAGGAAFHGHVRRRPAGSPPIRGFASSSAGGLFGVPALLRPEDFIQLARESVGRCEAIKRRLVTGQVAPGAETIRELDAISNTLCLAIDAAELARNVHHREDWREAAEAAFAGLSGYIHELNTDVGLYKAAKRTMDDPKVAAGLTEEERRTAQLLKAEFESSGIHLPEAERQEVRDILNEITSLETQFGSNVIMKRQGFQVDKEALLRQLPPEVVRSTILPHQPPHQPPGVLTLTTDAAVANAVLRYARDGELRRRMHQVVNTSPVENLDVLERLIKSRDALARKLGFPSYAHRFTADKMAGRPEKVEEFLMALAGKIRAKAEEELAVLRRAKKQQEGTEEFHQWDLPHYMASVKASRHALDARDVAAYFSLENCLRGLALLCQRLFGIALQRVPMHPTEGWAGQGEGGNNNEAIHKVVLVHPVEGQLGTIYLDLYPRPAKYTHHAQFTVRCGCLPKGSDSYQLPVVALVCNFAPSSSATGGDDGVILLSHSEVEALFHEFGHALHSLLSRTTFQHVAGTRAPVDFVETPSHLLEYFAWDQRVLREFAHHHRTKEPIPEELTSALRDSRAAFAGLDTQTQVLYSLVDQRLFGPQPLGQDPLSSDFLGSVSREMAACLPHAEGSLWHARFGHLTGYGAGYYGYLYDRVFASHIWQRLFARDPLSREAGEAVWRKLLIHGGAKDPNAILLDVLGEAPSIDSFLAELGVHSSQ